MSQEKARNQVLSDLIQTVHRLRAPGGCPWDQEQTPQSLRPYLIEEAYEVLEVLDQIRDPEEDLQDLTIQAEFSEELGDLLMQVLLHSEIASEAKAFDIYDVAKGLNDKLIRRHPHVFGEEKAIDAKDAVKNWEKEKAKEKAKKAKASVLDGLPKNLPALQRTERTIEKVSKVGFQWKDLQGPLAKIEEELAELKKEIAAANTGAKNQDRISHEIGDLLFSVCNLSSFLDVHPEDALRETNQRFERRFRHVEKRIKEKGKGLDESTLEEMDIYWHEAKKLESNS
jgi:tetrapyrrole methylase family protein / MazG family protein